MRNIAISDITKLEVTSPLPSALVTVTSVTTDPFVSIDGIPVATSITVSETVFNGETVVATGTGTFYGKTQFSKGSSKFILEGDTLTMTLEGAPTSDILTLTNAGQTSVRAE